MKLTTQEQISATELEVQILSDILAIGVFDPNVKFSDLCVQRAEAMARLNALRVRQGVLVPLGVSGQGLDGNGG